VLFQSWLDKPDHVLPEADPTTFTGLVKMYLEDPEDLGFRSQGEGANLALGVEVRYSAAAPDHAAEQAVDGDAATWWSAGGFPPQWIEIDFGGAHDIAGLKLNPSQSPAGATVHRVLGRGPGTDGQLVLLETIQTETRDGQVITVTPESPWLGLESLRIATDASPSWVSWREIVVLAAD
jgi:hypothetical protein